MDGFVLCGITCFFGGDGGGGGGGGIIIFLTGGYRGGAILGTD